MPALVEADVLATLSAQTDLLVLPVVGTVRSNRAWLETYLTQSAPKPAPTPGGRAKQDLGPDEESNAWGSFFDDADAAVLMDLKTIGSEIMQEPDGEIGREGPDPLPEDAEEL
jgi:hypothetical protein